jgi:hypothetical protein
MACERYNFVVDSLTFCSNRAGLFSFKTNDFTGDIEFICKIPYVTYFYACNLICNCCLKTCDDCAKVNGLPPATCSSPDKTPKTP